MTDYVFHITQNQGLDPETFFETFLLVAPDGNELIPLYVGECHWQGQACVYACTEISAELREAWNQATDLVAMMTLTNALHQALKLPHDNFDLVYCEWYEGTTHRWTLMAMEHEEGQDWLTRGLNALG